MSTSARPIVGGLYRRIYRRSPLICVSSYTGEQVSAALPGVSTTVIPNGVDADRYAHPAKATKPDKRGPTILAVGQMKPRKGYHILIEAICQVRDTIPDVQVICIGDTSDASYRDTIQAQIDAARLSDSVHLLGRVPDDVLLGWYHTADVFALPSVNVDGRFEGFGLVYLEASAAGLPVVGTLGCGAEDAIRDGETGFLVPQNDPAAIAQALVRLLRDAGLRAQMGAAGTAFAQQNTWARVAERVRAVYGSISPMNRE
jgi:glycosyltransferase involved in cell wall biosynthesis